MSPFNTVLQAFVRTRHRRNEIARFWKETWQPGSGAVTRTRTPAAPPALPTLLYCSSNPHLITPFSARTCTITTESSVGYCVPTTGRKGDGRSIVHVRCRLLLDVRARMRGRGAAGSLSPGVLCARTAHARPFSARRRRRPR